MTLSVPLRPLSSDRKVGVEIELSGLDETGIAGTVMHVLGGELRPAGPTEVTVADSEIGDVEIELDTKLADLLAQGPRQVLELARHVIPSEIITAPVPETALSRLDELVRALRAAGGLGTRSGVAAGFGVHFNPEVQSFEPADLLAIMRAWAMLEPWLRAREPMSLARRALPFTDPWPLALTDKLMGLPEEDVTLAALMSLYLRHAPSRNYGLDMLPLWHHLDAERVEDALGGDAKGGRPTWHFRLPSSRVDEARWTITGEWRKWQLVEAVASDRALLDELCSAWRAMPHGWPGNENDWITFLDERLG